MNRKWLYTAVTRATELKSADYDEEVLDKYLDKKVDNYKKKDYTHGRALAENYLLLTGSSHNSVKRVMDAVIASASKLKMVKSTRMSADRADNNERHHLNNIVPMCVSCNQRKSCW